MFELQSAQSETFNHFKFICKFSLSNKSRFIRGMSYTLIFIDEIEFGFQEKIKIAKIMTKKKPEQITI